SYQGDGNFASSSGMLNQSVTNPGATTTTSVASSVNPSTFGQSVTFTATVSHNAPGTPNGTVSFYDGGASIGQGAVSTTSGVSTATFSTPNLAVGTHTLTATYSGDANFAGSNSTLSGGQSVNKANTSTSVTSSLNTSTFGQTVTFAATVSVSFPGTTAAGSPAGT